MGKIMEVLTKKRFAKLVEEKIKDKPMPYIDAVCDVCEDRELDTADIGNLISPILKEKIKAEAVNLNMMKGGATLPI